MRLRDFATAICLGLMLTFQAACGTLATSPPNVQVAEQVHLRATQAAIAAELMFSLVDTTVRAITPSLMPAQAAQVQVAYRQAHNALLAVRAAKAAGDDAATLLKSQEVTAAINAINALLPHGSAP